MIVNKGFTLIELMIVIAIIGIMSIIALPIYSDYVTKVRLTEALFIHQSIVKNLDAEFKSGGAEAIWNLLYSFCIDTPEVTSFSGKSFACSTEKNNGSHAGMNFGYLSVNVPTDGSSVGIVFGNFLQEDYSTDKIKTFESISLSDDYQSSNIRYYPKGRNTEKTVFYLMNFVKYSENTPDNRRLKISRSSGGDYFAQPNRWHCMFGLSLPLISNLSASNRVRPAGCDLTAVINGEFASNTNAIDEKN